MSFILDALRKSEHERQRQTGPGIADLRPGSERAGFPLWAIAIAALLLINIVVVLALVVRNGTVQTGQLSTPERTAAAHTDTPADPVPVRSTNTPPVTSSATAPTRAESDDVPRSAAVAEPVALDRQVPTEAPPASSETAVQLRGSPRAAQGDPEILEALPTINDINARGARSLPELHLDIHVYAARPAERFVFINRRKYREGEQTPEGPIIERITRDGVVLTHNGLRFLMPRQ